VVLATGGLYRGVALGEGLCAEKIDGVHAL
jgi:hypothetical protein